MVALILTRSGYNELRPVIASGRDSIWVNAGVLTVDEVLELRAAGLELTTFSEPLNLATNAGIDFAADTIKEHHPNQTIWIEHINT